MTALIKQPRTGAGRIWGALRLIPLLALFALSIPGAAAQPAAPPLPSCATRPGAGHCFGPQELRSLYGVDTLLKRGITGKGRTIAIIVSFGSPTIRDDLHLFDEAVGLPDPTLEIRAPLGTKHPASSGWFGETTLDVEWAHVIAPGAKILLLTSPVDETEGTQGLPEFLKLEQYAVKHHADVIAQSWAATEDTLLDKKGRQVVKRFHAFYKDATGAGVTVVGASGDDGTAGYDLSVKHFYPYRVTQYPASDPLVLAVGATQLQGDDSNREEIAWNGSGGGFSKIFGEPAYQKGLSTATQKLLNGRRGVPDVAWNGSHQSPIIVFHSGHWYLSSGTSASNPQWAGLIALADQAAGRRLGDIHASLYRIARSNRYAADFNDIVSGAIKDPPPLAGTVEPLHAGPGWDPATGLGSPKAASLVADLSKHP